MVTVFDSRLVWRLMVIWMSLFLLLIANSATAKVLSVKVLAPTRVLVNDPFDVQIHVSVDVGTPPEPELPTIPGMALAFNANFKSTQIMPGRITKIFSYSGNVTRKGVFELAGIKAEGVPAPPVRLEAVDAGDAASAAPGKKRPPVFLEAVVDKTEVWQGGQITYDLYLYRANVNFLGAPSANLEDVLQPLGARKVDPALLSKSPQIVTLDGNRYEKILGARYVIYPLEPGEITIPSVRLRAQVQASRRQGSGDLFDQFFTFANGQEIEQICGGPVVSQPIKVTVKPLPDVGRPPSSFSGAVGQAFNLDADLNKRQVSVGETFNLKLTIKGSGNLESIKQPDLKFPEWIEVFESDRKDNFTYRDDRFFGEVSYDYVLIARKEGKITLGPVEFSYFSSGDGRYVTLKQGPFNLEVKPDEGQAMTYLQGKRKRIRVTGEDFRHIRTVGVRMVDESTPAYGSITFWSVCAGPWFALLGLVAKRRREDYLVRNPGVSQKIRAKGSVKTRLTHAEKLLSSGGSEFYAELEGALHELLSAQLGASTRGMTRDQLIQVHTGQTGEKENRLTPDLLNRLADTLDEMDQLHLLRVRIAPSEEAPYLSGSGAYSRKSGGSHEVFRVSPPIPIPCWVCRHLRGGSCRSCRRFEDRPSLRRYVHSGG